MQWWEEEDHSKLTNTYKTEGKYTEKVEASSAPIDAAAVPSK